MKANAVALSSTAPVDRSVQQWTGLVSGLLCLLAAGLFTLHYLHLRADFPANTPWMDWAKYTDEGWYGDAAIRFFTRGGHWFLPGDFNPAVALPVWPILLGLVFRVTGVSVVAARALAVSVFGFAALVAALLIYRALSDQHARQHPTAARSPAPSVAAASLLVLLAASPFLFAFSRMAILEPLLLLLGLLALLAASTLPQACTRPGAWLPSAIIIGILLPLMVLTKTTALFLLPSIVWMLWARSGYSLHRALPPLLTAGTLAGTLWLFYFGLVVHPHFLADYRYLFSANAYTGITLANGRQVLTDTLLDGRWISPALAPAALAAALLGLVLPVLRRQPLFASLLLWIAGYAAFLAYHDNLQPRYYLVLAVPLLALLPLTLGTLWLTLPAGPVQPSATSLARTTLLLTVALIGLTAVHEAITTVRYTRSPTYSFLSAADQIQRIITADPNHSQLLLSISGSDISLMTGLHSICDDFGTLELDDRLERYKPGWYAAWNHVEDDKMDALAPLVHLERVAAFPAYDDPERNLLILYRLESAGEHRAERRRRAHRHIPRRLVTRNGQQPSPTQLQH